MIVPVEMVDAITNAFEIAGCHRRYHCPLSRTIYLGKPPQKFLEAEKAVSEGRDDLAAFSFISTGKWSEVRS